MATASDFQSLPVELIQQVVEVLADELPSSQRELSCEPSVNLLDNDLKPLKNLSICSRTMRQLTILPLFKYLRVGMGAITSQKAKGTDADPCLKAMYKLARFMKQQGLLGKTLGVTCFFPLRSQLGLRFRANFIKKFGNMVLAINPEVLTLIGSANMLGDLSDLLVDERDEWAFGRRAHVLSLRQPLALAGPGNVGSWTAPTSVIHLRPWSEATINEGSCISAYSTYEYHNKTTPSILYTNRGLQWTRSSPAMFPFLRHFSYVSIFPLPDHIQEVATAIRSCPLLVSLRTQFIPSSNAQTNFLEDPTVVRKANISDVWMETTQSYRILAEQVQSWSDATRLRKWTTPDAKIEFDDIVGPILKGWTMIDACVWERIEVSVEDEESSTSQSNT